MDPLTALSVAGTIIQFVDFGNKLLKNSVQLYKSSRGSLKANEELELITGDLQCVISKLREASVGSPAGSVIGQNSSRSNFVEICDEAAKIAAELLERLNGLKVKDGRHRTWESLKAAVKSAWSKEEVQALERRLSLLRESLRSGSIDLLGQKIDDACIQSSNRFDSLDTQTQGILEAIANAKEGLSRDLFEFLSRLMCRSEAVNWDKHHKTRQMVASLRQNPPHSYASPPLEVDMITAQIEMLSVGNEEEGLFRRTIQKNILELLDYPDMTDRYEHLVEAHPQTFDWIFCNSDRWQFPWTDFGKWLREGQGIYWINGKPASGKSTLMKHIYDDRRTQGYLQHWSRKRTPGTVPFCLATFFFWSTGTVLQKSQDGLLRSLLFQVLGQHPELIPIVFPVRWAQLYSGKLSLGQEVHPDPWSSRQLHDALEHLVRQTQYPLNICFCIDGLDEFNGDTEQLCLFFKRLSAMSVNLKICVSSRPWVAFKQNFEGGASLRLQDLSAKDISTYVNDKLKASAAFTQLAARDEDLTLELTKEIVTRAEGVFLWVKVVIRLLLQGVNNRDTIPQLWARLHSFPTELNGLYQLILTQIEPIYFDWVSTAFQIMVASAQLAYDPFRKSPFVAVPGVTTVDQITSLDGVAPLTLMEFSFAMQEDYNLDDVLAMTQVQLNSRLEENQLHLTARCADLLEISGSWDLVRTPTSLKTIRWMHRTAHDFVRGCQIWTKAINDECFRDSSVCSLLFKASLISWNFMGQENGNCGISTIKSKFEEQQHVLFSNAMIYAHYADGHLPTRAIRSRLFTGIRDPMLLIGNILINEAASYCLLDIVEDMLVRTPDRSRKSSARALLRQVCSPEHFTSSIYPYPTRRFLDSLINMGGFAPRFIPDHKGVEDWARSAGRTPVVPHVDFADPRDKRSLTACETSRFIESYLSTIKILLKAEVDPMNSLDSLPRYFVLPMQTLQATVEKSVQVYRDNVSRPQVIAMIVLNEIELALIDEARRQVEAKFSTKKRKRPTPQNKKVIVISDDSESEGVEFLSENPVGQDKRIKIKEDYETEIQRCDR